MSPTRRQLLKWGVASGAMAGIGLAAGWRLLPPSPRKTGESTTNLAAALYASLGAEERTKVCLDYEHPFRQHHNRGVPAGGEWVALLGRESRQLVVDLVDAGLSETGRARVPAQYYSRILGANACCVALFGNPVTGPYQVVVTGPHLNLRVGGTNREGVAFGGPQVWGDQAGDGELGLPGNAYRGQLERGQRLISSLSTAQQRTVRQAKAPVQTDITFQGASGRFDGIAVGDLPLAKRNAARDLVDDLLGTYSEADHAYASECLAHNGGIDALHLADYSVDHQGGRNVGDGASQIFRLEGPAAVFYYRGEPHLHAYLNVGMDGEQPMSVGETLGDNAAPRTRMDVRVLFEDALLAETGADLAYYHGESVAGRLRAGTIRTGDIYSLESWGEDVTVVDIEGEDFAAPLRAAANAQGMTPRAGQSYRVATTSYIADAMADEVLGPIDRSESGRMLRHAAIEYFRNRGFDPSRPATEEGTT